MTADENKEKKKVSARPQHFSVPETPDGEYRLIGTQCKKCGDSFYPPRVVCANCGAMEMDSVKLSDKGVVYSYTIVYNTYPMMLLSSKVPFISAQIQLLPEKAWLLAWLRYCDIDKVKVGMEVELTPFTFSEDPETIQLGPAFRPVDQSVWTGKGGD